MNSVGRGLGIAVIVLAASAPAHGNIIINEILANEPSVYRSLEWIELWHTGEEGTGSIELRLAVDDDTCSLGRPDLRPGEYMILCRRLFAENGSPGFESFWGDGSGVWGDCPGETYRQPLEASFLLRNDGGRVMLLDSSGSILSELAWSESGADGFSWERIEPGGDSVGQSIDPSGATPGRLNSLTPIPDDLGISNRPVSFDDNLARVTLEIHNRGTQPNQNALLTIVKDSSTWPGALPDTLEISSLPDLDCGDSLTVRRTYQFAPSYTWLTASLSRDDRTSNNLVTLVIPGGEYPPVLLSEFFPGPVPEPGCEWIELYVRADTGVDLQGWKVADTRRDAAIAESAFAVRPGERLILAADSQAFRSAYPHCEAVIREPAVWPVLNDDGDSLLLMDSFGVVADRCSYRGTFERGYTWCRDTDRNPPGPWGRSGNPGGSPGEVNTVIPLDVPREITLEVAPRVFSPDGDGYQDSTVISISPVPDESTRIRIFDRRGRVVRSLSAPLDNAAVVWHGRSDAGRRLPVGIYIVSVEFEDRGSARQTTVIAR